MTKKTVVGLLLVTALGAACGSVETSESQINGQSDADCEVAVVGGGVGGLHTAFRLGASLGSRVCLFEKERALGGRIEDVSLDADPSAPDAARVGVGARRVMETQTVLFSLAKELGLELEKPPNQTDLISARKVFSFSKDEIAEKAYPTIPKPTVPDKDRETVIYDLLRASPERATLPNPRYPDFQTYVRKVAGDEQYAFLRDMSRFRADFEYPLDARGYLDYLDEEWDVCCQPEYPKGGMSSFVRAMERRSTESGVRIYKEEEVSAIKKYDGRYELTTSKRRVRATKVVINAPPSAIGKMTGDVAQRLKDHPNLAELVGVKVVTVTQFWSDAWWKDIKNPTVTENAGVWRGWTTDHCLNFIEIPVEPYAAAQKVTRSVYVDNKACADFWDDLARQGTEKVEAEIHAGLGALFNNGGVSTPASVTIPKPAKTIVKVWPGAWYWLKAGATLTNASLTDWAVEPLPGEAIALVGEAYNVQRSGWSDAAYKSSIKLLNTKYGMSLAGVKPRTVLRASLGPRSMSGSGH